MHNEIYKNYKIKNYKVLIKIIEWFLDIIFNKEI